MTSPPLVILPGYLREAVRAAADFERAQLRVQIAAAATDEMLRSRFAPILARFVRDVERAQRRRQQAAARERKRRHQRTGRGYS